MLPVHDVPATIFRFSDWKAQNSKPIIDDILRIFSKKASFEISPGLSAMPACLERASTGFLAANETLAYLLALVGIAHTLLEDEVKYDSLVDLFSGSMKPCRLW